MTSQGQADASLQHLHRTVLLDEAVDLLVHKKDGIYVDGTFGRGGHSRLILERLESGGRLIGIDKDPQAVATGQALASEHEQFDMAHGSFADLDSVLSDRSVALIDGMLLDLGVSSPQLDAADRGFSFMRNGPLDMRMDTSREPTAAQWLNSAAEREIADVLWQLGEERFSRRIAGAIVRQREESPLTTTAELVALIDQAVPRKEKHKHVATRSFQAIRIYINRELEDLEEGLDQALSALAPGGRLVVIAFHSLEDRIVKRFMRDKARGPELPRHLPVTASETESDFRLIGKAMKPGEQEVRDNPRARSAVMRVIERRADTEAVQ